MSKLALGIIETVGLAAAIDAADVAVKSANIKIVGYELAKGNGMATIKIEGTVGAVKAAIDAAVTSASKVNKVWGRSIIPRPSDGIEILIYNGETVGLEMNQKEEKEDDEKYQEKIEDVIVSNMEDEDKKDDGCNLCGDPECPRRKGDLRKMCIHYEEFKKRREI